jgi:hypothetical protein
MQFGADGHQQASSDDGVQRSTWGDDREAAHGLSGGLLAGHQQWQQASTVLSSAFSTFESIEPDSSWHEQPARNIIMPLII